VEKTFFLVKFDISVSLQTRRFRTIKYTGKKM